MNFTSVIPNMISGFEIFKLADVVIDIFMNTPAPHKNFPKNKLPYYGAYMRKLFAALTENKRLFIQVRVPTVENLLLNLETETGAKTMVQEIFHAAKSILHQ